MRLLKPEEYDPGRRVYVKGLDVFGVIQQDGPRTRVVVCEPPMPGHRYAITAKSALYDDSPVDRGSR